jgi:hypothetical protein
MGAHRFGTFEVLAGRAHVGFLGVSWVLLRAGFTVYVSLWPNTIGWYVGWCRYSARQVAFMREVGL